MRKSLNCRSISRDLYLFAGLVIAIIIIFSIWYSIRSYKEESKLIINTLEEKAMLIESTLNDDIDYVSYQMEFLGNQITSGNYKDLNFVYQSLSHSKANHKVNISTTWNMFSWVNKDFQLVADGEAGILEQPKDLSIRDYIPHTVEVPWKFHLGKPVHGAVSRQWIIPGGMGYIDEKGDYIGAVVFGFAISSVIAKLENTIKAKGVSFAILDKDSNIIAESRNNKVIKSDSPLIEALKARTLSANVGILSKQSLFENNSSYAYYYNADKYPFTIITAYDQTLVKADLINKIFSKLVEFSLISFLVFAMIWLLRKTIINPITQLSSIANNLALGKANQNIKLPRSNSYEINNLTMQLINIRRSARRQQKLSKKNSELLKVINDYDKEKEEFLRDMYHNINTPLNAIINGAELARTKMLGNDIDSYREYFNAIHDCGMQLKSFTTEILNPEMLDIKEILERCVKIQKKVTLERQSTLNLTLENDIPQIWADKTRLQQVVLSTLYHSLYYVSAGKQTSIITSVERLSDNEPVSLIIKIEDNGWGHDEEMRERDWNARFKVDSNSYSRNPEIMKLSLSSIRHIVELHHGVFDIQAKAGSGSIFTIKLPYLSKETLLNSPDRNSAKSRKKGSSNIVRFPTA